MADVIIHRCTLRVVRRGGWSWGADPRRLLEAVVSAFPRLLASRLAGLLPDDAEAEISAPLRITVPLRLTELLALGAAAGGGPSVATDSRLAPLGDLLESLLKEHPSLGQFVRPETPPADEPPTPGRAREDDEGRVVPRRSPLLRLLAAWHARGELELRLSAFAPAALEAWHAALLDTDESLPPAGVPATAEAVRRLVRELAGQSPRAAAPRAEVLRRRVAVAVAVAESLGVLTTGDDLRRALDEALPLAQTRPPGDAAPARERHDVTREATATARGAWEPGAPAADVAVPPATTAAPRPTRGSEVYVPSALPFLLLGPLAQFGYLATLAAALEAARLSDDAPLFAVALAYKVLPPPERGWRRKPAAALAAAAFAGLAEPPPEQSLTDFSQRLAPHVSTLDAALAYVLTRGHNPLKPLVLCRTPGARPGLLLADAEGILPVAWADDLEGLLPTLRQFGQTTLLVPAGTADPWLLRSLDEGGFLFVTDAPPARGETWRRLQRSPAERWHTNDRSGAEKSLLRAARLLADAGEEARRLWQALGVERVGVPLASDVRLETGLTLAASFALGMLSWTLWRAREPVNPLLALERFGDLDARVRLGERAVNVRLPLGRRYRDLYEHGMLEGIADVPWLDGRGVEFSGG